MLIRPLAVVGRTADGVRRALKEAIAAVPGDAVLRLEADGPPEPEAEPVLRSAHLRRVTPPEMNLDVVVPGRRTPTFRERGARNGRADPRGGRERTPAQTELFTATPG